MTSQDVGGVELAHAAVHTKRHGWQHYVRAGANGPVVVLLHGYGDSWRSFELLFPLLARDFQLFVPDHRGHGDSERAATYTVADFTSDAIAFIEAVPRQRVHLVGHSLGGIVAQRVAAARPDLVDHLVLIGTAPTAAGHAGLAEFRAELSAYPDALPREVIEGFQASTTFTPLPPERLRVFVDESVKLDIATWRGAADGLIHEPADAAENRIEAPTLVLWGEQDSIFDSASQEALARNIPNMVTIHYPDAGHAPNWEIPERVAQDIATFLGGTRNVTE